MNRGLDQTLAWILAVLAAGGIYLGIYFGVRLTKGKAPGTEDLTFDQGHLPPEPDAHDPRFAADDHGHDHDKQGNDGDSHSSPSSSASSGGHSSGGEGEKHWEYSGPSGPEHWAGLDEKFSSCAAGREQSPINLTKAVAKSGLPRLNFHYRPTRMKLVHNGHTLQANTEDAGTLDYDGDTYQLVQFHMHTPSEHRINGNSSEIEIHFVHRNEQRQLLVVGVMVDGGSKEFKAISPILSHLPKAAGEEGSEASVDVTHLLPAKGDFYQYAGSLTTPPCSEGVKWFVLKQKQIFSEKQIDSLIKVLRYNARPLQRLDGRVITTTN